METNYGFNTSTFPYIEDTINQGYTLCLDKSGEEKISAWFLKTDKTTFPVIQEKYPLVLKSLDDKLSAQDKKSFFMRLLFCIFDIMSAMLKDSYCRSHENRETQLQKFLDEHYGSMVWVQKYGEKIIAVWEAEPPADDDYIHEKSRTAGDFKPLFPNRVMYQINREDNFDQILERLVN
jgi:hypothetical protein